MQVPGQMKQNGTQGELFPLANNKTKLLSAKLKPECRYHNKRNEMEGKEDFPSCSRRNKIATNQGKTQMQVPQQTTQIGRQGELSPPFHKETKLQPSKVKPERTYHN